MTPYTLLFVGSLIGCHPESTETEVITVSYGQYDPERDCFRSVEEEVSSEDWPGWSSNCAGGTEGTVADPEGHCLWFTPACGPLNIPALSPCGTVEGCCDGDLPLANPSDPVCTDTD